MAVERASGGTSLIDVLDRVLDKGIVIDAWVRLSLVGIDLITVEARVVVASIDTYLKYAEAVGAVASASRPGDSSSGWSAVAKANTALADQLRVLPPGSSSGSSGTPAPSTAGHAELIPRARPPRYRRPVD
jgi:hypothetical protein